MLLSIYLPFSDYRTSLVEGFRRMPTPDWPTPAVPGFTRRFGSAHARFLPGFQGWVGESHLLLGGSVISLNLPYAMRDLGIGRVRLIRKACFFDGIHNGRFEILVDVRGEGLGRDEAVQALQRLLDSPVRIADGSGHHLSRSGPLIAKAWSRATVRHGASEHPELVASTRPICSVESDANLGFYRRTAGWSAPSSGPQTEIMSISRQGASARPIECLVISNPAQAGWEYGPGIRASQYRAAARYIRSHMLRLTQDIESLVFFVDRLEDGPVSDQAQHALNEYTRRILRFRRKLQEVDAADLVEAAYRTLERLKPGVAESLRVKIHRSRMRLNVKQKVMALLELGESGNLFSGDLIMEQVMGDKVEGDKFENINAGQGNAIGRGASATFTGSGNSQSAQLSQDLRKLSEMIQAAPPQGLDAADVETEVTLLQAAAAKAEAGDEKGAVSILKKTGQWVLDMGKAAGGAVLAAVIKAQLGLP